MEIEINRGKPVLKVTINGNLESPFVVWSSINWTTARSELKRLRREIFGLSKQLDSCPVAERGPVAKKLRSVQRYALRSEANIAMSIRKVTQINSGRGTAGSDLFIATTPTERGVIFMDLLKLNLKDWDPLPTRRVMIPKADGRLRPLGIPSIMDRIIQNMVKEVLEPEWEFQFEASSFGFRPGRSVHDAVRKVFSFLYKQTDRDLFVVEGDIVGCYDNISHDYLLNCLRFFPARGLIGKWLRTGILFDMVYYKAEFGTPQGSLVSPLLCNICLHGLQSELGIVMNKGNRALIDNYRTTNKRRFVRYADDFVVFCRSFDDAQLVVRELGPLLAKRGLTLSELKTKISPVSAGFIFLGFNIQVKPPLHLKHRISRVASGPNNLITNLRTVDNTVLITPSKKSVISFKSKLKEAFVRFVGKDNSLLITHINRMLRGYAQSKRVWICSKVFRDIDSYLFTLQMLYTKRRHPNKSVAWRVGQYFTHLRRPPINNRWVFCRPTNKSHIMYQLKWFASRPFYPMVRGDACTDDVAFEQYFKDRQSDLFKNRCFDVLGVLDSMLASSQDGECPLCKETLFSGEQLHKHHIIEKKLLGNDTFKNLVWVHKSCHFDYHRMPDKDKIIIRDSLLAYKERMPSAAQLRIKAKKLNVFA